MHSSSVIEEGARTPPSTLCQHVLTIPPGSEYNDLSVSADDRFLYLARDTEQGDIWLLTLK